MTKIVVLSTENAKDVSIMFAGFSPLEAHAVATAAVGYFANLAIEAEVERRLLAVEANARLEEVKEE
jgi:hypothetical protein